jgi:hypothetical protein
MVTVADLKDQILTNDRAILHCQFCNAEYSANAGDYWYLPKSYAFKCCGQPMQLVTKHIIYRQIKRIKPMRHYDYFIWAFVALLLLMVIAKLSGC